MWPGRRASRARPPGLRVAFGLAQLTGTGAGQFGVFYFSNALGRGDGLDDAEQAFGVGAIGLALFAARGLQRKGGTSYTPVGI